MPLDKSLYVCMYKTYTKLMIFSKISSIKFINIPRKQYTYVFTHSNVYVRINQLIQLRNIKQKNVQSLHIRTLFYQHYPFIVRCSSKLKGKYWYKNYTIVCLKQTYTYNYGTDCDNMMFIMAYFYTWLMPPWCKYNMQKFI